MSSVNRIDVAPDGTLQIRFLKDDGGWHRTSIEPGEDVDAQMARVNAHLQQLGSAALPNHASVTARAATEHTPARVNAFRAKRNSRGANNGQAQPDK